MKEITAGTPAANSNLLVDDIILKFDSLEIEDDKHLINLVKRTEIGRMVELVVFRDRQVRTEYVEIGRREDFVDKADRR